MKPRHWLLIATLGGTLLACGSDGGDDNDLDPGPREGACEPDVYVGGFEIELRDAFTSVQGKVEDAVTPGRVPVVGDSAGACALMGPPSLFCDPACGSGQTCDANGTCVDLAAGVSVGTVIIEGLTSPVEMTSSPPVFFYTNLGTLEHPAFDEGDDIVLIADGEGEVDAFALGGVGVAPLVLPSASASLASGQAVQLAWTAPQVADAGTIHLELNIAQHGGTPGWIECEVPDTGSFEIPVALTDALLARGFSGFPSLAVTRRSADSTTTSVGCVELTVSSRVTLDVSIPGLTSCSTNEDCLDGEVCMGDLTCG